MAKGSARRDVQHPLAGSSLITYPPLKRHARRMRPSVACPSCDAPVSLTALRHAARESHPLASAREHRGAYLRAAGVFALTAVLCVAAVLLFREALPQAPAAPSSPYFAANVKAAESTPADEWEKGTLPHLFQGDAQWAEVPYGFGTLETAGSAPTSLAMAYVQQTGDASLTPADFAAFASEGELTALDTSTLTALVVAGAAAHGLDALPIEASEPAIRQALGHRRPVVVVTKPATFAAAPACIVLEGVNARSELDIADPSNAVRTQQSWTFDDVIRASAALFAISAQGAS
ncbi:papain-like cysteine protease family protein [Adlercreutzia sp. ZJ473]|uniref:papain-like cysteine protease family protein n=1 Tax=Adlercreutzia sp. ZJ473 TaxID=2722822 RepID=UPI0015563114|nr:papain-like cysteine protease family protein [Adlercreutzia sp. ZJ473]